MIQQQRRINDRDCTTSIGQLAFLSDLLRGVRQPIPAILFKQIRQLRRAEVQLPDFMFSKEFQILDLLETIGKTTQGDYGWSRELDKHLALQRQAQPQWDALCLMLLCIIFHDDSLHG